MAVRAKVRISSLKKGGRVETVALVNAGYESDVPEIVLPSRLAGRLGLWPELPEEAELEEYASVTGVAKLHVIPDCVKVRILNREARAGAVISEFEKEALLSDKLVGALGLVLEDVGKGLWRLRGERKVRRSEPPQEW